eukprot:TRINITY_DN13251_c0_g1_i1.p4 TRINITY_DN13251_c0_g1~~TRINITY_DN13251_c0_g1_i1.p4  ORF type:complete len:107 (-),score=0.07 TRINITY_DN13251_c0_g1_i1:123-410(-)
MCIRDSQLGEDCHSDGSHHGAVRYRWRHDRRQVRHGDGAGLWRCDESVLVLVLRQYGAEEVQRPAGRRKQCAAVLRDGARTGTEGGLGDAQGVHH